MSRADVCLSVRVTQAEAEQLQAWVRRRVEAGVTVTISDVLRRCVQAVVRDEPSMAPYLVTSEEAAGGGLADAPAARGGGEGGGLR